MIKAFKRSTAKKRKKSLTLSAAIKRSPKIMVDAEDIARVIRDIHAKRAVCSTGSICRCGAWVVKEAPSDNGCINCSFISNNSGVILQHMTKGYEDNLHSYDKEVCRGVDVNLSDIVSKLPGETTIYSKLSYGRHAVNDCESYSDISNLI